MLLGMRATFSKKAGSPVSSFTMSSNVAEWTNDTNDVINFTNTSTGGPFSLVTWEVFSGGWNALPGIPDGDNWISTASEIVNQVAGFGEYLIRVTVENEFGISTSEPQMLTVSGLYVSFFAEEFEIYSSTPIDLTSNSVGEIAWYYWYFNVVDSDGTTVLTPYDFYTGDANPTLNIGLNNLEIFFGIGPLVGKFLGVRLEVSDVVEGSTTGEHTETNYLQALEDPIGTTYPFYEDGVINVNFTGTLAFEQVGIGGLGDSATGGQSGSGGCGGGYNAGILSPIVGETYTIEVPFDNGMDSTIYDDAFMPIAIVAAAVGSASVGVSTLNTAGSPIAFTGGAGGASEPVSIGGLAYGGGGGAPGSDNGNGDPGGNAPAGYGAGINVFGGGGDGGMVGDVSVHGQSPSGNGGGGGGGGHNSVDGPGEGGLLDSHGGYTVFVRNT